jgi:hypothetical protein
MTPEKNTPSYYKMRALRAMNAQTGSTFPFLTSYIRTLLTSLKINRIIHSRQVAVEKTQVHESLAPEALGRRLV